jgi:pimeloyl-ACP methyl ester carboxylesterase
MRGEFVDIEGARIYYYAAGTRGAGEPLVLIHGCLTSSHLWSCVVPCLPAGHRTVIVDLLGHGRSDPPAGQPLTASAHAKRLVLLLDALRIERACLVGHGFGAAVANLVAIHDSTRASRLCFVNSTLREGQGRSWSLLRGARYVPTPLLMSAVRARMRRGYVDAERANRSLDHYMRPFAAPEGHAVLGAQLAALPSEDDRAAYRIVLDATQKPTALVVGANDPFESVGAARAVLALNPSATLDVLPDSHYAPEESPERVAQVITQLLER